MKNTKVLVQTSIQASIWFMLLILGLGIFAVKGEAVAAASIADAQMTDGGGSTSGGSYGSTFICTGTLSCGDLYETYLGKTMQYCQYNYAKFCDWDPLDSKCVNKPEASCSSAASSTDCKNQLGCVWEDPNVLSTPQCSSGLEYCGSSCKNLLTDEYNCGYCGKKCLTGQTCENGRCISPLPACSSKPCSVPYHKAVIPCIQGSPGICTPTDGYCGNGIKDGTEECDSKQESKPCETADHHPGFMDCKKDCSGWDQSTCVATQYCFPDCSADGRWISYDSSFSVNTDGKMSRAGTGTGELISDGIELFAGKTYYFNANVNGDVKIIIDGKCLSNKTMVQEDCGLGKTLYENNVLSPEFTVPAVSEKSFNNVLYKNATIHIFITGTGSVANLSLRESAPQAHYDEFPEAFSSSGCCPDTYCWDGQQCVNASSWIDDPSKEPIWNNIFNDDRHWVSQHVNTSANMNGTGFRCVLNDSGYAEWKLSRIKYDWNFNASGYCARETDCFAGKDVSAIGITLGGSVQCVPSGELIQGSDSNHYCHQGNWTTKTYVIATLLQNVTHTHPYVLQCYDDLSALYNIVPENENILSACVISNLDNTQVITGLVYAGGKEAARKIVNDLEQEYQTIYKTDYENNVNCFDDISLLGTSNFSKCIDISDSDTGLHVYRETNYEFLIISNDDVAGIEQYTFFGTFFRNIAEFFRGLFTRSTNLESRAYDSLDYVTNYDRIYVLRDVNANVTAIEEYKFDEVLAKPVTVFYINYNGTSNETNPIDEMRIFTSLNKTLSLPTKVLATNYTYNATYQELVVKTDKTSGIWSYFTSVLRTRTVVGRDVETGVNAGTATNGSAGHRK